jgi:hypothetical protein
MCLIFENFLIQRSGLNYLFIQTRTLNDDDEEKIAFSWISIESQFIIS